MARTMMFETIRDGVLAWWGNPFALTATLAAMVALAGMLLDRRHMRRADLDRVSLINWAPVSGAALIVAIVCLSMALRH